MLDGLVNGYMVYYHVNDSLNLHPPILPPLHHLRLQPRNDLRFLKPHKSFDLDMLNKLLMRPLVDSGLLDTGCGIPAEVLPDIFAPFFTSKTTDSKRGSGLGLSIVDSVMKDHGGYLEVISTPGRGTSFLLYFPVTHQTPDELKSHEIQHGTETILIVDDDKVQQTVLVRLMEKLGYKTNIKKSGEAAVDYLKTNPHDLMLLDMKLGPGIDGTETFYRSLQINPEQRAIILSGFADTARVQTALDMGVGAFLKKPITLEVLATAVRAELDRPVKSLSI